MAQSIKDYSPKQYVNVPEYVKKDILWWYKFLPLYNGVSLMLYEEWSEPDSLCSSDSCLIGCGGFGEGKYFHAAFPQKIINTMYGITILEMLAVIVCLKLWGNHFRGKKIQMFYVSLPVCVLVNNGKSSSENLQDCLREVAFLAARYEF